MVTGTCKPYGVQRYRNGLLRTEYKYQVPPVRRIHPFIHRYQRAIRDLSSVPMYGVLRHLLEICHLRLSFLVHLQRVQSKNGTLEILVITYLTNNQCSNAGGYELTTSKRRNVARRSPIKDRWISTRRTVKHANRIFGIAKKNYVAIIPYSRVQYKYGVRRTHTE